MSDWEHILLLEEDVYSRTRARGPLQVIVLGRESVLYIYIGFWEKRKSYLPYFHRFLLIWRGHEAAPLFSYCSHQSAETITFSTLGVSCTHVIISDAAESLPTQKPTPAGGETETVFV